MIGALVYLRVTSLRNLVAYRVRRLRQPRYLVGVAAAAVYIYFFFLRRLRGVGGGGADLQRIGAEFFTAFVGALCVMACAYALIRVAFAWISPPPAAGLQFSEAEIAFLFPAPLSRKALIHFRLVGAQLAILVTSVLTAFVFGRLSFGAANSVTRAAGIWVMLSTFSLHISGTHLAVARLKEGSARPVLWRAVAVAAIILYAAAVVWSAVAFLNMPSSAGLLSGGGMDRLAPSLVASSPLRWLILPFRIVLGPYFAADVPGFLLAMIPALGVLALHYHWVASSEYRFEEGSIALAERRATTKAAMLRGEAPKVGAFKRRAQPGPFPLSPKGPPEVAFLWKNLLSMRSSLLSLRTVGIAIMLTFWVSFVMGPVLSTKGGGSYAPIVAVFCSIASGYTLLLGPQVARQDLRSDLAIADILKTYPIAGWRLALGELLAPAAVLSAVLWLLIIVGSFAVDAGGRLEWLTPGVRLTAALCLGAAAPVVCAVQLIVPNLLAVLLPGWYQASRSRGGGIENFGQRLILGVANMAFALMVLAPAAVFASLIIFSAFMHIGLAAAIVLAAAVVVPILTGEAAVGLWLIGELFRGFDLSTEIR
jgi:hypothetical protein